MIECNAATADKDLVAFQGALSFADEDKSEGARLSIHLNLHLSLPLYVNDTHVIQHHLKAKTEDMGGGGVQEEPPV